MSRAQATEVSSPLSLFPFIGVLLSTMGALLVVLICVSRSARDTALREADARQAAAVVADGDESHAKLEELNEYLAKLNAVRAEAEKRLQDDHLRLSHIEDHARRLQEDLQKLRHSVMELVALEEDHIDNRQEGEQEVKRLEELIVSTRATITTIKEENKTKKRSYAIIPYEGPHGTRRRPIYIECRKNAVILQPEGIELTPQDFRPPLGAGNPLAAALRAAREYIIRDEGTQSSKATEPYPLILVRPEGILAYYRVRQAIESWDSAFGYELIDNDWTLEFPGSNPLLAEVEYRAVEQSRSRQQMLVAAAPRAYGHVGAGDDAIGFGGDEELGGGDGEYEEGAGDFGGSAGGRERGISGTDGGGGRGRGHRRGLGAGGTGAVNIAENGEHGEFFAHGVSQGGQGSAGTSGDGEGSPTGSGGPVRDGKVAEPGAGAVTDAGGAETGGGSGLAGGSTQVAGNGGGVPITNAQPGGSTSIVAGTSDGTSSSFGAPPPAPVSATGSSLADGVGEAGLMARNRTTAPVATPRGSAASEGSTNGGEPPSLAMQMNKQRHIPARERGQNWAIRDRSPSSVPIQRTIRIAVRADRLTVQPDVAHFGQEEKGHDVALDGPTVDRIDDFVSVVQERVEEWGIAGNGLYWRPVLLLSVSPGGQSRANDLARLLRNSGIEVKFEATANRPQEGPPRATR